MNVNIILIGLMGAGKTTVGKNLANVLDNYVFIDTDEAIERKENRKISEIFKEQSEDYFRQIETNTIRELVKTQNQIISIGGGGFEKEENRQLLLNSGKVFYLQADIDILYNRIKDDSTRPLLYCNNPKEKLEELLHKREKNYKKAHFIINTENKSMKEIIKEIIKEL